MNDMDKTQRPTLETYLTKQYPFNVLADPDGGYVAVFPDLPGCMSQGETPEEVVEMAEDARRLWIETAFEDGLAIPEPTVTGEYSGKFVVRLPRSLHRDLAEEAEREGVSLNHHVSTLLSRRDALARVEQRLTAMEQQMAAATPNTAGREMHPVRGEAVRRA